MIIRTRLKDFSRLRGGFKYRYYKVISLPVKEPRDFTPGMRLVHGARPSVVECLLKAGVGSVRIDTVTGD